MPTNLPPEYFDVEEQYRTAQSPAEKIALLEEMHSIVPKHKGTDHLRADLRRRISKLKEAAESRKGGSRQSSPFHIDREGAGQIAIIGPANVGKSALVSALTNATPEVANYPFTTTRPIPGMMLIDNVQVQLIDTPPLSKDYVEPQLIELIKRADLIFVVLDLQAYPIAQFQDTLTLLEERRIVPDRFRDQYSGQRRMFYKPILGLVNKVDDEHFDDEFEVLCELLGEAECPLFPISAVTKRNIEQLKQVVFEKLGIVRIYSKPPGKDPDYSRPFILKKGDTLEAFAIQVHKDFAKNLKSARVWGSGVFDGQKVGRDHQLDDGDIVELRT